MTTIAGRVPIVRRIRFRFLVLGLGAILVVLPAMGWVVELIHTHPISVADTSTAAPATIAPVVGLVSSPAHVQAVDTLAPLASRVDSVWLPSGNIDSPGFYQVKWNRWIPHTALAAPMMGPVTYPPNNLSDVTGLPLRGDFVAYTAWDINSVSTSFPRPELAVWAYYGAGEPGRSYIVPIHYMAPEERKFFPQAEPWDSEARNLVAVPANVDKWKGPDVSQGYPVVGLGGFQGTVYRLIFRNLKRGWYLVVMTQHGETVQKMVCQVEY